MIHITPKDKIYAYFTLNSCINDFMVVYLRSLSYLYDLL
nr:MAG TPA: hypothetical protein [Inoviridae sp.]